MDPPTRLFGTPSSRGVLLAPMVRAGHLPLRVLSLYLGSTCAFGEEIIAKKFSQTLRFENSLLGTVDFNLPNGKLVYRTCAYERGRNVLQLGLGDAADVRSAVGLLEDGDVAGVDLNMGCPEPFSISGGMGAALLKKPEISYEIVKALREFVPRSVLVSCKIRLLDTAKETIDLVRVLESAGAGAITVHARRPGDKPKFPARWNDLMDVVSAVKVPVVVNGDVNTLMDVEEILKMTNGVPCGTMVARGAIADARAAFSNAKYDNAAHALNEYMVASELCGQDFHLEKWLAGQILRYRHGETNDKKRNERMCNAKCYPDLRAAFSLPVISPVDRRASWWGNRPVVNDFESWNSAVKRAMAEGDAYKVIDGVESTLTEDLSVRKVMLMRESARVSDKDGGSHCYKRVCL